MQMPFTAQASVPPAKNIVVVVVVVIARAAAGADIAGVSTVTRVPYVESRVRATAVAACCCKNY